MAHKSPCWITSNRLFVLLMVIATTFLAQWAPYPTQKVPKDRAGKPNLLAPMPRTEQERRPIFAEKNRRSNQPVIPGA